MHDQHPRLIIVEYFPRRYRAAVFQKQELCVEYAKEKGRRDGEVAQCQESEHTRAINRVNELHPRAYERQDQQETYDDRQIAIAYFPFLHLSPEDPCRRILSQWLNSGLDRRVYFRHICDRIPSLLPCGLPFFLR
eukprot:201405-Amorphochlora_amoeboformis.AAC.1